MTALELTLSEAGNTPPLTPAKERELLAGWTSRRAEIQRTLIERNRLFAISCAMEMNTSTVERGDLVAAAFLGLTRAAQRFEPDRNIRFISYASWWIQQAVLNEMANNGRTVRIPINVQKDLKQARPEIESGATAEEVADAHGWPASKAQTVIQAAKQRPPLNLDDPFRMDRPDGLKLSEMLPGPGPVPDDCVEAIHHQQMVETGLARLTPREARIVSRYYGLEDGDGGDGVTLQEIADDYDLSRERVRQIVENALVKMRKRIEKDVGPGAHHKAAAAPGGHRR